MKRAVLFLLMICMFFSMVGCTGGESGENAGTTATTETTEPSEVIVMDAGTPIPTQTNNRAYYHIFVGSFSDLVTSGVLSSVLITSTTVTTAPAKAWAWKAFGSARSILPPPTTSTM